MGIVNLEAMAAGKAVVASRTGGVPEIVVENETGLLVPPGDAVALAEALRRVAGDDALRTRLGAAGLERVAKFSRGRPSRIRIRGFTRRHRGDFRRGARP